MSFLFAPLVVDLVTICTYTQGPTTLEIVFIAGRSDWITVRDTRLNFGEGALRQLGLQKTKPSFVNRKVVMQWKGRLYSAAKPDAEGVYMTQYLEALSLFPGAGSKARYAYIKTWTP